mmetsp:Transcript_15155/g.18194  ORF Transcript_15155/g.18194 Transcript_15155/m.18194 type:complete len:366 (+) Transcript_15155:117-1214(+)|eukprot:jgi/Bigna1/88939/estExt_fgenesh1_pg.C_400151
MEHNYSLHNVETAPFRRRRGLSGCSKWTNLMKAGAGAVVVLIVLFLSHATLAQGSGKGSWLGYAMRGNTPKHRAASNPIRSNVLDSRSFTSGHPVFAAKRPDVRAESWRIDPWRIDPFGIFVSSPSYNRRMQNDFFDLFDEFADMEDYLLARRRAREAYNDAIKETMKGKENRDDAPHAKQAVARRRPTTNKELEIDTPFGLSTLGKTWSIPDLQTSHTKDAYQYTFDVQGMDRDNLKLSIQDNIIIIEGNKMVETDNGYHSSSFKRSFSLPEDANLDSLRTQELADGRLMLSAKRKIPLPETEGNMREIAIERLPRESKNKDMAATEQDEGSPVRGRAPKASAANDGTVSDVPPEKPGPSEASS